MIRSEMMERMSSSEFFEWMALDLVEPFGDKRGDIQAAMICQLLANINRPPSQPAYRLDQFLPKFVPDPVQPVKQQTAEEQAAIWGAIMAAQNASIPS